MVHHWFLGVELKDWLTIIAIAVSPLIALQVQERLNKNKERRGRKEWVFRVLMDTRGNRLSDSHVQALNAIDLTFGGLRAGQATSEAEKIVVGAWKSYLDHLNTPYPTDPVAGGTWNGRSQELFVNLLAAMAKDVGYSFEREEISRGGYNPVAHGNMAAEQEAIRKLLVQQLSGERPVRVQIVSSPN